MRIGILLDSLEESCQFEILQGIWNSSTAVKIKFIVFIGEIQLQFHGIDIHYQNITGHIKASNLDGLIIFSGSISDSIRKKEMIDLYNKLPKIPIVNIGLHDKINTCISIDNSNSLREIINHLVNYHKYKNIAFIKGPIDHEESEKRFSAFCDYFNSSKLKINSHLIVDNSSNFSEETGKRGVRILLDDKKVEFDAIVAADDTIAIGAIEELTSRGIHVPENVAVTGFDDIPEASSITSPLTTVGQPFYIIGRTSLDVLLQKINNEIIAQEIKVETKPIYRKSCGCMNTGYTLSVKSSDEIYNEGEAKQKLNSELNELIYLHCCYSEADLKTKIADFIDSLFLIKHMDNTKQLFEQLHDLIIYMYKKGENVYLCQTLITICITNLLAYFDEVDLRFKIVNFFQEARYLADETFTKVITQNSIQKEKQMKNFHTVSQILLSIYDFDELVNVLYKSLPLIHINSCFLVLYKSKAIYSEDDCLVIPKESTLYLAYNEKQNYLKNGPMDFTTTEFLPLELNNLDEAKKSIFMPLAFKDTNYGYIVCEYTSKEPVIIFELLRNHITSAIHNSLLLSGVNEANKQKSNFLANFAHEIKTPLTIITNTFSSYIKTNGSNKELVQIKNNMESMQQNIVNILLTGKLDQGSFSFNNEEILNLSQILNRKITFFRQKATELKITMEVSIKDIFYIKMDSYALDCILSNLIDNALKYNNIGGNISIHLFRSNNKLVFSINNSGPPIPEEQIENIFKPYYQLSHKKKNFQGIGMGLFIVRKMLTAVGGEVAVKSSEQFGTTFIVEWLDNAPSRKDESLIISDSIIQPKYSYESQLIEIINAPINEDKKTVMVIEDNKQMLYFLQQSLLPHYNVHCAPDGQIALNDFEKIPQPDLIISDIMMDNMDGYTFMSQLYKEKKNRGIPIIFITAKTTVDEKMKALSRGVVDFISKPFIIDELLLKIHNIISLSEKQEDSFIEDFEESLLAALKYKKDERGRVSLTRVLNKLQEKYQLKDREIIIIKHIYNNKIHKQIAFDMNLSEQTVRNLSHKIYNKCYVKSKAELIEIINGLF